MMSSKCLPILCLSNTDPTARPISARPRSGARLRRTAWRMRLRLRSVAGTMEPLAQSSEARFADYVDALTTVVGRGDRAGPLKDYCVGLLMPGERKSVEPMAAVVAPARVSAKHQSLLHLVGQAAWSDEAVLAKVRELVLPAVEAQGKIEAWIVDDTGFAKKGVHSVGVARQYCGRLG